MALEDEPARRLATPDAEARRGVDRSAVRAKARAAIQAGSLPDRHPDRIWGGQGVGSDCVICGLRITRAEVEYVIEFVRHGKDPGVDAYQVHLRCLAAWIYERHNRAKPSNVRG